MTEGRLVVVEDHSAEGGLGAAVLRTLDETCEHRVHLTYLAVREMSTSGTSDELLDAAGVWARPIAAAGRSIAKGT